MRISLRLIQQYRRQRDECADALRAIMGQTRSESGSDDPMEPFAYDAEWERLARAADAALANVPTYADRLRRIFAFINSSEGGKRG